MHVLYIIYKFIPILYKHLLLSAQFTDNIEREYSDVKDKFSQCTDII